MDGRLREWSRRQTRGTAEQVELRIQCGSGSGSWLATLRSRPHIPGVIVVTTKAVPPTPPTTSTPTTSTPTTRAAPRHPNTHTHSIYQRLCSIGYCESLVVVVAVAIVDVVVVVVVVVVVDLGSVFLSINLREPLVLRISNE